MAKGIVHVIDDLVVINDGKSEYIIPKNEGFLDVSKMRIKGQKQMSLCEIRKVYNEVAAYKGYFQKDFYVGPDKVVLN